MNQWVSADKLKLLSQSFLIKQNTVIWACWLPWLVTVLMQSFVKLPGKFHFLFFIIIIIIIVSAALCFSEKYLLIEEIYYVVQDRLCVCG